MTFRRLNRLEYNNTVRDLLGTTARPADRFPEDGRRFGFDNVADVLSISAVHAELYERTADELIETTFPDAAALRRLGACEATTGQEPCVATLLEGFARRAWRRPVVRSEVDRLLALVALARKDGDTASAGIRLALKAVLVSPHFLFRIELDPQPSSSAPHALGAHAIAARLSYFLWSSMPDDELSRAADAGELRDAASVAGQVRRMLADPKAEALVTGFASQWLQTRRLEQHQVDAKRFPGFDDALRKSMREETESFFREVLKGGLGIDQLLTGSFSFLDARLARHYGLPAGTAVAKVPVAAPRGGLLTQGSVLTVTSHPDRTSPVARGKWVLDQLLCEPPPPAPPGVEGLPPAQVSGGTLRTRLEQHRADPKCAGCHALMDPIGFGLENFDGIGAHRTKDEGFPIDATGRLPDGRSFEGARALSRLLADDPRFASCVAQRLYVYALGRLVDESQTSLDTPVLARITESFTRGGRRLPELIELIATAETFRTRRGEPATRGGTP